MTRKAYVIIPMMVIVSASMGCSTQQESELTKDENASTQIHLLGRVQIIDAASIIDLSEKKYASFENSLGLVFKNPDNSSNIIGEPIALPFIHINSTNGFSYAAQLYPAFGIQAKLREGDPPSIGPARKHLYWFDSRDIGFNAELPTDYYQSLISNTTPIPVSGDDCAYKTDKTMMPVCNAVTLPTGGKVQVGFKDLLAHIKPKAGYQDLNGRYNRPMELIGSHVIQQFSYFVLEYDMSFGTSYFAPIGTWALTQSKYASPIDSQSQLLARAQGAISAREFQPQPFFSSIPLSMQLYADMQMNSIETHGLDEFPAPEVLSRSDVTKLYLFWRSKILLKYGLVSYAYEDEPWEEGSGIFEFTNAITDERSSISLFFYDTPLVYKKNDTEGLVIGSVWDEASTSPYKLLIWPKRTISIEGATQSAASSAASAQTNILNREAEADLAYLRNLSQEKLVEVSKERWRAVKSLESAVKRFRDSDSETHELFAQEILSARAAAKRANDVQRERNC